MDRRDGDKDEERDAAEWSESASWPGVRECSAGRRARAQEPSITETTHVEEAERAVFGEVLPAAVEADRGGPGAQLAKLVDLLRCAAAEDRKHGGEGLWAALVVVERGDDARNAARLVDDGDLLDARTVRTAAVVARRSARATIEGLAEVLDELRAAAERLVLAEREHRGGVGARALLSARRRARALAHADPTEVVRAVEEEHALRALAVAPSAARLLIELRERRRHRDVNDVADVRLVDTHAERARRDDDAALVAAPRAVARRALLEGEPRVVSLDVAALEARRARRAVDRTHELRSDRVALLAREAVHDAALLRALRDEVDELLRHGPQRALSEHDEVHVRAVQAAAHRCDGCAHRERLDDVALHARRRRGGERDRGEGREGALEVAQLAVVRAKVVPPLRDAVRLVDDEEREEPLVVEALEKRRHRIRARELLGREVEQLHARGARAERGDGVAALALRRRRVERARRDTEGVHCGDLIGGERDERRYDESDAGKEKRRELVAETLAAPGRGEDEGVAPRKHGVDRGALTSTEAAQPERAAQRAQHGVRPAAALAVDLAARAAPLRSIARRGERSGVELVVAEAVGARAASTARGALLRRVARRAEGSPIDLIAAEDIVVGDERVATLDERVAARLRGGRTPSMRPQHDVVVAAAAAVAPSRAQLG